MIICCHSTVKKTKSFCLINRDLSQLWPRFYPLTNLVSGEQLWGLYFLEWFRLQGSVALSPGSRLSCLWFHSSPLSLCSHRGLGWQKSGLCSSPGQVPLGLHFCSSVRQGPWMPISLHLSPNSLNCKMESKPLPWRPW